MAEPLTADDIARMEHRARRFQGAWTGTSGTLAGYVILLLGEVRRRSPCAYAAGSFISSGGPRSVRRRSRVSGA